MAKQGRVARYIRVDKPWGWSHEVYVTASLSICVIGVKPNGVCSIHIHEHKWNRFVVSQGELCIRYYDGRNKITNATTLRYGESLDVPPNQRHQFVALEPTLATEIYYGVVNSNDIIRYSKSGGLV